MRKLLLIIFTLPIISYATSLDMATLKCRDMQLTTITTLQDVQNMCLISKQSSSDGLFVVNFRNDTTKETVTCYFASNMPTAKLNGCK